MREIKFRVWDKENNEMLYSDRMYLKIYEIDQIYAYKGGQQLADIEVMQFTNLKDKDDREIYEGDILTQSIRTEFGSLQENKVGVMVWHEHGMWAIKFEDDSPINFEGTCPPPQIIGNIYENGDLLSKGRE